MLKIKKILIATVVICSVWGNVNGANLQEKIQQIIARKDQQKVEYTISIIDPQDGKVVYSHNAAKPLTPASNMKIVTSFTTLKQLGTNYKFVTTAGLVGNKLVVIGCGDPLLGYDGKNFVSQIVEALKAKSITQLDGIIIDSSIFDNECVHPNWPRTQINRSYSCEVNGLNYNGNCIKISAAVNNGKLNLTKSPDTEFLKMLNNVKVITKGDSAIGSNRTQQENEIIVFGKCRRPASFDVAIERPNLMFGTLLMESLNRAGINVVNPITEETVNSPEFQMVTEFETPIIEVLHNCNKDSLNIAAECMIKLLAAKTSGRAGSWQGGRDAIGSYLQTLGIDKTEFYIDDGSGLSSINKISSNALAKILLEAYKSELWATFKESFAIGGVDGTIKKQFYKDKYKNRVFAKTGYINGVRAMSGICIGTNNDKEYIFSIITNHANYPTKTAITNIVEAIVDEG
ncbi:MAG: D-alanyl-D-alanine carboxypeptidase/D-alanyl-D-alanine-endopeptidase [Planctomycetes bacterium GWF2_41_51]|nr:MAG: D-alanyl-D-alanine carboxypeptidase/D-alanyl-D-alanine-endopeptidase [Planctomycetes bacterium GWF2_41_51]HBG27300.1 D-alanyl-D-alanine carboxypeptidase/D-alanyl-D-alanine-endopeptidase [Phycisphaerales bacterium]